MNTQLKYNPNILNQGGEMVPINSYSLANTTPPATYPYNNPNSPVMVAHGVVDIAEILRVQANAMLRSREAHVSETNSDRFDISGYLGVYDDEAYGVYNSVDKYSKSEVFWHSSQVKQVYLTYEDALSFARAGVAALNGLEEKDIPPMKVDCNWRQKIFDKPADG